MWKRTPRASLIHDPSFSWFYGSPFERFWLHVRKARGRWQELSNPTDSDHNSIGTEPGKQPPMSQDLLLWVPALIGLTIAMIGFAGYIMGWQLLLPPMMWAILGLGVFFAFGIALMDRYGVANLWEDDRNKTEQIRTRVEAYYKKGQELYQTLGTDSSIKPEDARHFVSDEWVHPVGEYLHGVLGHRKASYFLNVVRGSEPDAASIRQLGYQKALVRARIIDRLERLREILADLHSHVGPSTAGSVYGRGRSRWL
jgi:hypothetical protein